MNEKQDKRLLAIFSLAILLLGVFGAFIIAVFDAGVALVFAVVATILTLVFGLMSWKEKLARVAVTIVIIFSILAVLSGIYLFVGGEDDMLEHKVTMEKKQEKNKAVNEK